MASEKLDSSKTRWHFEPNWWIVLLTLVLAVMAWFQWKVANDNLQIANRAYVCVRDANVWSSRKGTFGATDDAIGIGEGLRPVDIIVTVANSGTTPAFDLTGEMKIRDTRSPIGIVFEPAAADAKVGRQSVQTMPKDGTLIYATFLPLSAAAIRSFRSQQRFLSATGLITYRDVFGKQHSTEFCYTYTPESDSLSPCSYHNRVD